MKDSKSYIIHGDGVTDDTEALQAYTEGKDVYYLDGEKFNGYLKPSEETMSEDQR